MFYISLLGCVQLDESTGVHVKCVHNGTSHSRGSPLYLISIRKRDKKFPFTKNKQDIVKTKKNYIIVFNQCLYYFTFSFSKVGVILDYRILCTSWICFFWCFDDFPCFLLYTVRSYSLV